jgi:hypothetical protein
VYKREKVGAAKEFSFCVRRRPEASVTTGRRRMDDYVARLSMLVSCAWPEGNALAILPSAPAM